MFTLKYRKSWERMIAKHVMNIGGKIESSQISARTSGSLNEGLPIKIVRDKFQRK